MTETKIDGNTFPVRQESFGAQIENYPEDLRRPITNPNVELPSSPHANDTISDLPPAPEEVAPVDAVEEASPSKVSYVKELFKKVWTLFAPDATKDESPITEAKKIDQTHQVIGSRPVLERPRAEAAKGMEMLAAVLKKAADEKMVKEVNADEEPIPADEEKTLRSFAHGGEAELERMTFDVHKNQISIREKEGVTIKDSIVQDAEEKKRLWKQYLDLKEEAARKARQSKIFGWIGAGAGVIGGALFLGGLIAGVITGGLTTAIAVGLGIATGMAAISSGSTGITSSVFGFLSNKRSGESFVAKEKGNIKKDEILTKIQNMEQNDNNITQLWSSLGEVLRNTPRDMFR